MKLARIQIAHELLEEVLQLPTGVKIRRVFPPDQHIYDQRHVELVLEGDMLPVDEIRDGEPIPEVMAQVTYVEGETVPKCLLEFAGL
jgi:hypothetical protein